MTKTEIFLNIVDIMKHDASCCKDEPGADAEIFRAKITDDMADEAFLYVMQSYLATFHVLGHVSFRQQERRGIRFEVKRYGDALYVVSTASDSQLSVGDKIIQIDGLSVREFGALHSEMLYGEPEERQGFCWFNLLSFAHEVTVVKADSDQVATYPIMRNGSWPQQERYWCKQLKENIAYMRLLDFADAEPIDKMYKENDALLRSSDYLIIDVRENGGGSDSTYFPLLEFCLPQGKTMADLPDGPFDCGIEINYTERNCDSRLERFEQMLSSDLPQDTRLFLTKLSEHLRNNRGRGFTSAASDDDAPLPYVGAAVPKKVYIIADENCASSGDAFVDTMRKSSKVTVVGRPTMGILDFSNCSQAVFDNYTLVYPTSRSMYLDKGVQMRGRGVPVDIFIPWTPEHLKRDVDLETVLDLIAQEKE